MHSSTLAEASRAHTAPMSTDSCCHRSEPTSPAAAQPAHGGWRRWGAFTAAGFAVFALLLGSNLPNSLFPLYAEVYGLSPVGVTLLFATYTLLVIPAVLVFGPLSDAKGRREVLIAAIVVAAVAAGLFAAAGGVVLLFIAQAVQAMAMGALQGTAAPTLVEHDPSEQPRRAAMAASALTITGAAAGPLLGGLLAQYAALPLRLCFLVEVAVLAAALIAVTDAITARDDRRRWRPRRPTVPPEIRRSFVIAGISAFVAWAVTGLFLSLIPSFVIEVLDDRSIAVAGAVMALMLGTSAVAQLAGQRVQSVRAQTVGLMVMVCGVVALIFAVVDKSLGILLGASVLAGVGQGLAFMGSLGDVSEIAPEHRKGDIVASYYVVIYLATAVPAVGVGVLAQLASLSTAFVVFAFVVIVICATGMVGLTSELRARRRETDDDSATAA
jgi:MFS family permease